MKTPFLESVTPAANLNKTENWYFQVFCKNCYVLYKQNANGQCKSFCTRHYCNMISRNKCTLEKHCGRFMTFKNIPFLVCLFIYPIGPIATRLSLISTHVIPPSFPACYPLCAIGGRGGVEDVALSLRTPHKRG